MADSEYSADVIVVGGGGSGLAAAIEARALGRSVIVLEKADAVGGTTGRSVGSIAATGTPHQIREGIKDSPADHFADMPLFAAKWGRRPDNEALRRLLTDNVPETLRWLMGMGVVFYGPLEEPPHRRPRMHNVLPTSRAYVHFLRKRALRVGVDIRLRTRAERFVVEDGRVTGVVCEAAGRKQRFTARGAVVLTTGDYTANPELKARYISEKISRIQAINPNSTGDGHTMAFELGAEVRNGDVLPLFTRFLAPTRKKLVQRLPPWRIIGLLINWSMRNVPAGILRPFVMDFLTTFLAPSAKLISASVLVSSEGNVVRDDRGDLVSALVDLPDHSVFLVFDEQVARAFRAWPNFVSTAPGIGYAYLQDYRRSRRDIFFSAGSVRELAHKIRVPADRLEAQLAALAADGGKGLANGPLYALGPVKMLLTLADGGLAVSDRLEVLDREGAPIPGLYAAGSVGQGGLFLEGHGHHLGWAFTSGRLAGRHAANDAVSPPAAQGADRAAADGGA